MHVAGAQGGQHRLRQPVALDRDRRLAHPEQAVAGAADPQRAGGILVQHGDRRFGRRRERQRRRGDAVAHPDQLAVRIAEQHAAVAQPADRGGPRRPGAQLRKRDRARHPAVGGGAVQGAVGGDDPQARGRSAEQGAARAGRQRQRQRPQRGVADRPQRAAVVQGDGRLGPGQADDRRGGAQRACAAAFADHPVHAAAGADPHAAVGCGEQALHPVVAEVVAVVDGLPAPVGQVDAFDAVAVVGDPQPPPPRVEREPLDAAVAHQFGADRLARRLRPEHLEVVPVEAVQPVLGADPQEPLVVVHQRGDGVLRQAVVGRVVVERARVGRRRGAGPGRGERGKCREHGEPCPEAPGTGRRSVALVAARIAAHLTPFGAGPRSLSAARPGPVCQRPQRPA